MSSEAKFVQIACAAGTEGAGDTDLFALDEEGQAWKYSWYFGRWQRLKMERYRGGPPSLTAPPPTTTERREDDD